eukprot:1157920-Pelagomonas_calceolata.AAC.5
MNDFQKLRCVGGVCVQTVVQLLVRPGHHVLERQPEAEECGWSVCTECGVTTGRPGRHERQLEQRCVRLVCQRRGRGKLLQPKFSTQKQKVHKADSSVR